MVPRFVDLVDQGEREAGHSCLGEAVRQRRCRLRVELRRIRAAVVHGRDDGVLPGGEFGDPLGIRDVSGDAGLLDAREA